MKYGEHTRIDIWAKIFVYKLGTLVVSKLPVSVLLLVRCLDEVVLYTSLASLA